MTLRTWPAEVREFTDRLTGAAIRQLTRYKGHSNHLYFTNPGWYDGGRRMVFQSDRENRTNLFSIELATGGITQISETDGGAMQSMYLNPTRDEGYFWCGPEVRAIDLHSGEERTLHAIEPDWNHSNISVTADGRYVCTADREPVDLPFEVEIRTGYVGFPETFKARPRCRIWRIPIDGGTAEVVHEEPCWIGHVNTSPTDPDLLSFCHEGPWERVDQRMWGLRPSEGKAWKIRPEQPGEAIGHEYWLADGQTLGYHGRTAAGEVFGFIRHDNTEQVEAPFPTGSQHFHSNDRSLIIGDGHGGRTPYILLWTFDGQAFSEPRVLCIHRCSRHIQRTHVHPRLTPDGTQVVYTSDHTGYGQVHLVDVPERIESLPTIDEAQQGPPRPKVSGEGGRGLRSTFGQPRPIDRRGDR
jgi:oligogalacturonide lyase